MVEYIGKFRSMNAHESFVDLKNGIRGKCLYSYNTPVAVIYYDLEIQQEWVILGNEHNYSSTTSKQITVWLEDNEVIYCGYHLDARVRKKLINKNKIDVVDLYNMIED